MAETILGKLLARLATAMLVMIPVVADSAPIYGGVLETCSHWMDDQKSPDSAKAHADHAWLMGYMTAANMLAHTPPWLDKDRKEAEIQKDFDTICTKYPNGTVFESAEALLVSYRMIPPPPN